MKRKKLLPIQSQEALAQIGQNIKEARLKRRISTVLMAQKTGVTRVTIGKIEKGNPNVSIGAYALVIFMLGLTDKLKTLLDPFQDKEGINLERQRYPKRIRYKKSEGLLL